MQKLHDSIKIKLNEIRQLCVMLNIQEFSLFGSSVNGNFQEGKSDIDCFIKTKPEDIHKIVRLEFELRKMFNTKIDIFHSAWNLHPEIEKYIERNKFVIFKATSINDN